jgi:hypothetical protein
VGDPGDRPPVAGIDTERHLVAAVAQGIREQGERLDVAAAAERRDQHAHGSV